MCPTMNNWYIVFDMLTISLSVTRSSLAWDCISAEHITRTIEEILLRLSLPLQNCHGQCYDGASSMAVCRTGVSTELLAKER